MNELVQVFLVEGMEILQELERDVLELEKNPGNIELTKKIFRGIHTIKGSAGLVGIDSISSIAHRLEDMIDDVNRSGAILGSDFFNAMMNSLETMNYLFHSIALDKQLSFAESSFKIFRVSLSLQGFFQTIEPEPIHMIEKLKDIGPLAEININISRVPLLKDLNPVENYMSWVIFLESTHSENEMNQFVRTFTNGSQIRILDVTESYINDHMIADKLTGELLIEHGVIDENYLQETLENRKKIGEILIENAAAAPAQIDSILEIQQKARVQNRLNAIRIDVRQYEKIYQISEQIESTHRRFKEMIIQQKIEDRELLEVLDEVQEAVRSLRSEITMAKYGTLDDIFARCRYIVETTAKEGKKEIDFFTDGQETKIDKGIIQLLSDVLKHLVRNSVDHGIESPDERLAKGKSPRGRISLRAFETDQGLLVEYTDDGRGLAAEKIRKKAVEKGLLKPGQQVKDKELYQLILHPGFSTSKEISYLSGRGIGLDVVYHEIKGINGSIEINSAPDVGTQFRFKIPYLTSHFIC